MVSTVKHSNTSATRRRSEATKASEDVRPASTAKPAAPKDEVAQDPFRLFSVTSLLSPVMPRAAAAASGVRRGLSAVDAPPPAAPPVAPAPEAKPPEGLGVGAESARVKRAEQRLKAAGFDPGKADGKLTAKTAKALEDFQRASGLPVTGRLDERTFERLGNVAQRAKKHGGRLLGQGQHSGRIRQVEQRLQKLGYDVGKVDGTFDKDTAAAVRAFKGDQKELRNRHHLMGDHAQNVLRKEANALGHDPLRTRVKPSRARRRDDRLVGAAARKLRPDGTRGIREGHRGPSVRVIQQHLKAAGFDPKRTDGRFDERTGGAVRAFQRRSDLPETGRVDGRTWSRLQKATLEATGPASPKQRVGERSGAVRTTEKLLKQLGHNPGVVDGRYTAQTERAVDAFRRKHKMKPADGVGGGTLEALRRAVRNKRANGPISARGRQQMKNLLAIAERNASGKRPMGWCLKAVGDYLDATSYGKIGNGKAPRLPLARNFAEWLNSGRTYDKVGLRKLKLDNPYKAPPGAIIVVRPGTPGTAHPTAGDIAIKGRGNRLFNDGEMSYGGPGNFYKGNNYVLGIYVPK